MLFRKKVGFGHFFDPKIWFVFRQSSENRFSPCKPIAFPLGFAKNSLWQLSPLAGPLVGPLRNRLGPGPKDNEHNYAIRKADSSTMQSFGAHSALQGIRFGHCKARKNWKIPLFDPLFLTALAPRG